MPRVRERLRPSRLDPCLLMEASHRILLANLLSLGSAVVVVTLCLGTGLTALRISRTRLKDIGTTTVVAVVLGGGLHATAILAVTSLFGVGFSQVMAGLLVVAAIAYRDIVKAPQCLYACVSVLLRAHQTKRRPLAAILLTMLFGLVVAFGLPPAVDWDSLAYHLAVPDEWLTHGKLSRLADNYHVAFVGHPHMLYLLFLAVGIPSGINVLNGLFLLALGVLTFSAARHHFGTATGRIAFWLLWASPILLLVGTSPRIDVTLGLYLMTAHYLLLRQFPNPSTRGMALAGAILGMSVGIKYMAGAYAVALAPLVMAASIAAHPARGSARWRPLVAFTTACTICAAPWVVKNIVLLGFPFYPFGAPIRVEPWLASLHGPDLAPVGVNSTVYELHSQIRREFNLPDLVMRPERLAPDGDAALSFPNLAFVLVPIALLSARSRIVLGWVAPAGIYVTIVLLVSASTSLRYFIPVIAPLTVVASVVLAEARRRLPDAMRPVAVAALLGVAALPAFAISRRVRDGRPDLLAIGLVPPDTYVRRFWETAAYMKAADWANSHLSAQDTLAMLFEARGFHIRVPHRKDMLLRNWAFLNVPRASGSCFPGLNMTHLLVNDHAIDFFRSRGAKLETIDWHRFNDLEREC